MLSTTDLDQIAYLVALGAHEAYPAPHQRLFQDSPGLRFDGSTLTVPHGPWHAAAHPNRRGVPAALMDPEVPDAADRVGPALTRRWIADGFTVDQHGRPIHPDWRQLLGDPRIGLPTGVGFFYRYGPNATVDAAVYRRRGTSADPGGLELLLIKRRRGGQWALPGGFSDRSDASPEATARRELAEETGLRVGGTAEIIVRKRPTGAQATLHAWTENAVVLIHGDPEYLAGAEPVAGDDAIDAGWFTQARIASLDMYDSHAPYIDRAITKLAVGART